MRGNNVVGIIFPNVYDSYMSELTALRSMGSVPFGGRYRLIDFPLSAMVECGIGQGRRYPQEQLSVTYGSYRLGPLVGPFEKERRNLSHSAF